MEGLECRGTCPNSRDEIPARKVVGEKTWPSNDFGGSPNIAPISGSWELSKMKRYTWKAEDIAALWSLAITLACMAEAPALRLCAACIAKGANIQWVSARLSQRFANFTKLDETSKQLPCTENSQADHLSSTGRPWSQ